MKCPKCGVAVSFWRLSTSAFCDACAESQREEKERRKQEEEHLAEERRRKEAEARRRDKEEKARIEQEQGGRIFAKCPVCGSMRYRVGRLPDAQGSVVAGTNRARFRPEEDWTGAYPLIAFACLSCGHIRLFLFEDDRAFLEQEVSSKGSTPL